MKPVKETRKRRNRRKGTLVTQNQEHESNISKLPDDLISHILSFLPTKFAVRTSILSNRWKYLWTNITNPDFKQEYSNNSQQVDSFIDFVDRVFKLRTPSHIQRFRFESRYSLSCSSRCSCCGVFSCESFSLLVEKWIGEAIRLNPSQIVLQVHYFSVPLSLFTCETVTTLILDPYEAIEPEIPYSVYLPNLKVLGLSSIPEDLLQMFINGCPVLEHLSFREWDFEKDGYVLNISAQTMKELKFMQYKAKKMFEIVINTPNLQDLDVTNNLKFCVENLQSLVHASIRLDNYYPEEEYYYESMDWKTRSDAFVELLRAVSGVKYLTLHFDSERDECEIDVEEFLHGAKLPTMHYLTSLKMVFDEYNCRKLIPQILESSPNLKYLFLEKIPWYEDFTRLLSCLKQSTCWQQFTDPNVQVQLVPGCSLLHLEEIQLEGFEGDKDDQMVVKYLLRNAKVLKLLKVIGVKLTLQEERKYYKKLLKLMKKAAGNCKIEFHRHHVQIPSLQVDLIENNLVVTKS